MERQENEHAMNGTLASRWPGRLAWGGVVLTAVLMLAGLALRASFGNAWLLLIAVSFAGVGVLIAIHVPDNPIGWLFLGFGVLAAFNHLAGAYAYRALVSDPGSLPAGDVAASLAAHYWHPGFGLFVFSFLLFPNGRLLSPGWRWVARATVVIYGGLALLGIFDTTLQEESDFDFPVRPLFHGPVSDAATSVWNALLWANLPLLPVAAWSLVARLRSSTGDESQQVKWFVYAVTVVMVAIPVSVLGLGAAYGVLLLPLIPASAAAAILKYRLYDIDVVINRTLVYGALTAILAGTYGVSVVLLQLALNGVTGDSGLAVAASTLAVAALFRPARSRIQATVDRRFFRRKYDVQRTLDAFTAGLRDEIALDALSAELIGVVTGTMQPAHVSLWLREPTR